MAYNTGNPVPSTDAKDFIDNCENIDKAVNSLDATFQDRLGVARSTYEGVLQGLSFFNVGTFAAGFTLTNSRQTLTYDGHEYGWSGVFPVGGKVVAAGSTPTPLGSGGWIDRTDVELRSDLSSDGGAQLVKNSKRWFDSIQSMLAATDLEIGQAVCTGSSVWKITLSTKGWALDNGTQYALPLNGVYIEDAGADPTEITDSSDAFDFVISKYNINTKRRFTICLAGGAYLVSREIALSSQCERLVISGGLASIKASTNMDAVLSWPAIVNVRVRSFSLSHSTGVTIASAMLYAGKGTGTGKTTRNIISDISGNNTTGAPVFLLCRQMWESKINRVRVDMDVSGQTGTVIKLDSCVNCQIVTSEFGYSAVGCQMSKSADVTYSCEGITLANSVTTYAAIAVKADNLTAGRFTGNVFDFCLTRAMEFSNGTDVTISGNWFANRSDSVASGNLIVALPTFSKIKIYGNHGVKNSSGTFFFASINSPGSKIWGNTGEGLQPGTWLDGIENFGNNFGIDATTANTFRGTNLTHWADAGQTGYLRARSGITTPSSGQLLNRLQLSAQNLNTANRVEIDHLQGTASDQPLVKIGWNGAYKYTLNLVTGDIEILTPGRGIKLTSLDGLVTKTLRLSNSGALELI